MQEECKKLGVTEFLVLMLNLRGCGLKQKIA